MSGSSVYYGFVTAMGHRMFYRECGSPDNPTVLLLHGFPTSSHQFRTLLEVLGENFHVVAPDYPSFGYTERSDPGQDCRGGYTFDLLADSVEEFIDALQIDKFSIFMFDFGAPVGFRLALRRTRQVTALIVQNGNAYEQGLGPLVRDTLNMSMEELRKLEMTLLSPEAVRNCYLAGCQKPEKISPDAWTLDQHFLERAEHRTAMLELIHDYKANVSQYPVWQSWLHDQNPPLLVLWGRGDPFFLVEGATAYRKDVPEARIHILDTGRFVLEEARSEVVSLIQNFLSGVHVRSFDPNRTKNSFVGAVPIAQEISWRTDEERTAPHRGPSE